MTMDGLRVPEGMTPERLRVMAGDVERQQWRDATSATLLRWADDLAAQIEGGGADDREAWRTPIDLVEANAAWVAGVGEVYDAGWQPLSGYRRPSEMAHSIGDYRVPAHWLPAPEPDPADPDTWPLAETWEDCARHVEAGGVVMCGRVGDPGWDIDPADRYTHLSRDDAPGRGGYLPRRLVPIPDAPAPESSPASESWRSPVDWDEADAAWAAGVCEQMLSDGWVDVTDGSCWNNPSEEFELAGRELGCFRIPADFAAPAPESSPDGERWSRPASVLDELRAERDALAAKLAAYPEVPEGHEVVVPPSEVVDVWGGGWGAILDRKVEGWYSAVNAIAGAAQDLRPDPKPEPRTERVPVLDALRDGRLVEVRPDRTGARTVFQVGSIVMTGSALAVRGAGPYKGLHVAADDEGCVEVLPEDGES